MVGRYPPIIKGLPHPSGHSGSLTSVSAEYGCMTECMGFIPSAPGKMHGKYRQGPWIHWKEKYIVNFKMLYHLVMNYHEKKLKQNV